MRWLLYGANGYTGELIAREAARRGMRPILAGRTAEAVEPLARELGLEARVFGLEAIDLDSVRAVLHCAGPFSRTSAPMVSACLRQGAHYLDITGEIAVFESIFARDEEARQAGVTLLPGVGFDVVPTDALAVMLSRRLPEADELWLAFHSPRGGMSRGTMRTAIEGAGRGGAVRREGRIVQVPMLYDVRTIPFRTGDRLAMTIPWGDVSTAWRSTGIPNIRVYNAASPRAVRRLERLLPLLPLLRWPPLNRLAQRVAIRRAGPTAEERARGLVHLWGRVARGFEERTMTMTVPEGYTFTVLASLASIERILAGGGRPGSFTPTQLFGTELALSLPGVTVD
jgi:short subunit dehydrogenase-like uncharacterized protein